MDKVARASLDALVAHMCADRDGDLIRDPTLFMPVSVALSKQARALADVCLRVALFPSARVDWIDHVEAALPSFLPSRGPLWQHALARILDRPDRFPLALDGASAIPAVLQYLRALVPKLPPEFKRPDLIQDAIEVADRTLIDKKKQRWKIARESEYVGKRRGLRTAWGAAQLIANAFGLTMADANATKRVFAKRDRSNLKSSK